MTSPAPIQWESAEQALVDTPAHGPKRVIRWAARSLFTSRTLSLIRFDLLKLRARSRSIPRRDATPSHDRLHLGSGSRLLPGWLNVDVTDSDYDIDFTRRLPWPSESFSFIVSQHVIEHLELFGELIPLLGELKRVLRPGGEIWLSCPDMEKICRLYSEGRSVELVADRLDRDRGYSTKGAPPQQIVNDLFHQWGEHRNLLDFTLLEWALKRAGFSDVCQVNEAALLERFPGFPPRCDDVMTLYVTSRA
jgi:predicted SAM-dependent methyltransferase